jgi:hypothetical protein
MHGRIEESMNATLNIALYNKKLKSIVKFIGRNAGLEVAGNVKELITKI